MRPGTRHRHARLIAPALIAVLLAGCGSSSPASNGLATKSPQQIVTAAKDAAAAAATAHVAGSILSAGKPITLNMELVAGKGGKGSIALDGLAVQVIEVDNAIYVRGSEAFYRRVAGDAAAKLLQGKWLKAPADTGSFASLASLTDLSSLIDATLSAHGELTNAGTSTLGGQQVVGVTDSSKEGTLYVAGTGTPYPVAIVKTGDGGRIAFNRWNQPVTLNAPTNALNINQLENGH